MNTKPRIPLTWSSAATEARNILGRAGMADVVGKSGSLIDKWADDEYPDHLPNARQIQLIDQACNAHAGSRPFLAVLDAKTSPATHEPMNLHLRMGCVIAEVGDVARVANEGIERAQDRERLCREIREARTALEQLERDVCSPLSVVSS